MYKAFGGENKKINNDMKYLINGIVDIIKLGMILFAVFYTFESGIVDYIVNLFK